MTERKWADEEIKLLQTLTQAISEAPDFHIALSVALLQVCEVTGWDYGEAWTPGNDGRVLELSPVWYCRNCRDYRSSASVPAFEQFRLCSEKFVLPPATGLPGRVWSSQQPEWIADVSAQSETYFLRNQIAKACGVKAGFGVPILANHQVLAVFVFFMSEVREEDGRLVELVAAAGTKLGAVLQRSNVMKATTVSQHL